MACFVSLCSFTSPKTLIQDIKTQKKENCRLHLSSSNFLKGICFRARGEELLCMKLNHNPAVTVFVDCKASCKIKVISGFWVGPDVDDGWGFVEAIINHIFDA